MIELNDITKEYPFYNKIALKNINLKFDEIGLVAISGKSGSGKTTLLNIIAGLDKPTHGNINKFLKDNIQYVLQDYDLIDKYTIYENILMPFDLNNINIDNNKINNLLNQFGLYEIKNRKVEKLSGGEKKKVSIIRALLHEPKILLCDEPIANLDHNNSIEILKLLKEISKETLVIISTHKLLEDEITYDRLIKLSNGEIIVDKLFNEKNKLKLETKYKKNNTKNKNLFKYIFKNIKHNSLKYFFFSLINIVCISEMLICLNIICYNPYNDIHKTINNEFIEIKKIKINKIDNSFEFISFNENELNKFKIKKYNLYKTVDNEINQFFEFDIYFTNYNYEISDGRNTKNNDEIIVSENIKNKVNKNITINNQQFKIVGYFKNNKNIISFDKNYTLSKDLFYPESIIFIEKPTKKELESLYQNGFIINSNESINIYNNFNKNLNTIKISKIIFLIFLVIFIAEIINLNIYILNKRKNEFAILELQNISFYTIKKLFNLEILCISLFNLFISFIIKTSILNNLIALYNYNIFKNNYIIAISFNLIILFITIIISNSFIYKIKNKTIIELLYKIN